MGSTCRLWEPGQMALGALMALQHQNPQVLCSSHPAASNPLEQLKYIPGCFPGDWLKSEVMHEKPASSSIPRDLRSCHAV